ncbi:ArsR/SmtB family transcription factor [Actinokineospora diospyrosa]|uniref:DNA-binding transcriptional regulator, ArsR family n=1 Tax=Actinokineospora diospyrosa TaxID=103728 RepID=A0ABT1ILM2_9PSEU|nr:metalloregulator ArsR/SmtB family transcription factor [Actinokineospora diospyrosa]MCP2273551.1 DNA-binding transcriptional regulator, ArsR family [Actinokineospora diospyrosa]
MQPSGCLSEGVDVAVRDLDDVFRALADPHRRALLDRLNEHDGLSLRELCAGVAMSRQAVSKHLAALEAANLVTTVWRGREKLHHLNAEPVNAIADRWIRRYDRGRVRALADLKRALEHPVSLEDPVSTAEPTAEGPTEFVYTTYIDTTPEKLWQALTEPAFTSRYWGVELTSEWVAGAPMSWRENGVTITDPEQVVLVADRPTRLSYTWHTLSDEWRDSHGFDPAEIAVLAAQRRSKVTFDIEALEGRVRLTVTHDGFEPGSELVAGVSHGWPEILSSLKTLLETGEPLPPIKR